MTDTTTFRGYYAIVMTPFTAMGDLIWDDLGHECDWIVAAGAHGLVWPVNDSEFYALSYPERVQGFTVVADAVGDRIPFLAGVSATSKAGAVALTKAAAEAGADAVIALPPWAGGARMTSEALLTDYFRAIAEASDLPVFIQNLGGWVGSSLSTPFVVELCETLPGVEYVKEERNPHGRYVSELIAAASPAIKGVFTGGGLLGIVNGHLRGAAGNIASPEVADVEAHLWDLMEAGDVETAREIQDVEAAFAKSVHTAGPGARKEILVRRGVISSNARRSMGRATFNEADEAELAHAMEIIEAYLRV
jgi:4-hydroxy-tetrahydrodipicolinate synthase